MPRSPHEKKKYLKNPAIREKKYVERKRVVGIRRKGGEAKVGRAVSTRCRVGHTHSALSFSWCPTVDGVASCALVKKLSCVSVFCFFYTKSCHRHFRNFFRNNRLVFFFVFFFLNLVVSLFFFLSFPTGFNPSSDQNNRHQVRYYLGLRSKMVDYYKRNVACKSKT